MTVDHLARGERGAEDVAFVARLAAELSLPFRALRAEESVVRKNGNTSEARMREERLRLLRQGAAEFGSSAVYLAHHRDDQVETILLAALRGAGLRGLSGMRRRRRLDARDPESPLLVRPLLPVARSELLARLRERGHAFCTDETNLDPRYLRNRVRHEWLPAFRRELGDGFDRAILRLGRLAAMLERRARLRGRESALDRDAIHARAAELLGAPLARNAGRALLERSAAGATITLDVAKGERLSLVAGRLERAITERVSLPTRERRRLRLGRERVARLLAAFSSLGGEALRARLRRRNEFHLDPDRLAGELRVRARLPGDRFQPFGANAEIKLKDLFSARKTPPSRRDVCRVYADDLGIVAVEGIDIAARVALTPESTRALRIRGAS